MKNGALSAAVEDSLGSCMNHTHTAADVLTTDAAQTQEELALG